MSKRYLYPVLLIFCVACFFCVAPSFSQSSSETGKLKIHVTPKQAYVFVDGKAIRDGSHTLSLPVGNHKVSVHNYGYATQTKDVDIKAGQKTDLSVALQASGDKVSGPFGDIEFKGNPRAAVLLNGQTPDYFVGHVDEFNWNWIWHQRLLVHPGTYQVTVTRDGNTIWSGPVTAKAGEQVTVYLDHNGKTKTKEWKEGLNMPPQPRFRAGIASATVPISPVTAQLSAQSANLKCGQNTTLNWKTTDAADTSISGIGNVSAQGDHSVSPTANTNYVLTAKGPGGDVTQSVNVAVDAKPVASISLSQPEIHYHKIGDKVVQQDTTTLTWSSSNSNSVSISPFGNVDANGSRTITADPKTDATGPVNENETYSLTSANACGGSSTETATLHVTGSIDPPPALTLASLFYPTAYPTKKHPEAGLIASEKQQLMDIAGHFKDYQQYDQKGNLLIVANADVRGSSEYNKDLTERRATLVKNFLVSQGVPEDKIEIRADGKDQQLTQDQVKDLLSKDPQKSEKWETRHMRTTWLAYNRRADIVLQPRDIHSTQNYPSDVANAHLLWQQPMPSLKQVQKAEKMPANEQSMNSTSRNK